MWLRNIFSRRVERKIRERRHESRRMAPPDAPNFSADKVPNICMMDISVGGLCFLSDEALAVNSELTINDGDFNVSAEVICCVPIGDKPGRRYRIHCKFSSEQDKAEVYTLLFKVLDEEANELIV